MDIQVGSIVRKTSLDGYDNLFNPCEMYNYEHPDIPRNVNVCVGIVMDDLNSDVVVNWVQVCQYHHKTIEEYQTRTDRSILDVVGQL